MGRFETQPKALLLLGHLFRRFRLPVKAILLLTLPAYLLGCGTADTSKNAVKDKLAPKTLPIAIRSVSKGPTVPWEQVIAPRLEKYHIRVKLVGVRVITFQGGTKIDVVAWKTILGSGVGNPLSIGAFSTSSGTKPKLISYLIRSYDDKVTPKVPTLVKPLQIPNTNTVFVSIDPKVWLKNQSNVLNVCAMAAVGPKVALALMRQSDFVFNYGWYKGNFHLLEWKMTGKRDACSN